MPLTAAEKNKKLLVVVVMRKLLHIGVDLLRSGRPLTPTSLGMPPPGFDSQDTI